MIIRTEGTRRGRRVDERRVRSEEGRADLENAGCDDEIDDEMKEMSGQGNVTLVLRKV